MFSQEIKRAVLDSVFSSVCVRVGDGLRRAPDRPKRARTDG